MKKTFQVFLSIFLLLSSALADTNLPVGIKPIEGNFILNSTGKNLTIRANTEKSIAEWHSFNIGSGHGVDFFLPNTSAIFLNRVTGNDPSKIFGSLWSNGQIFLINQNGFLFGPGAKVNVGGLTASTLNISNHDFLNNNFVFKSLNKPASIRNEGSISANGIVNLFGGVVQNTGNIEAGAVNLAIGDQISLKLGENITSLVTINKELSEKVENVTEAIHNSGKIHGKDGAVRLLAKVQNGLYEALVNNTGTISADKAVFNNGVIQLTSNGPTYNSGQIEGANGITIESSLLENNGSISSGEDFQITLNGSKTVTRQAGDQTLIHIPGSAPVQRNNGFETISFGLWNKGSIESKGNMSILSTEGGIRNTNGSIFSAKDLLIESPTLVNERTDFRTNYGFETRWIGNAPHDFETWTDVSTRAEGARIEAIGNMVIKADNVTNWSSQLKSGGNFTLSATNFNNGSKVLQQTIHETWVRSGFRRRRRHAWYHNGTGFTLGEVFVDGDAIFGLSGTFTNTGLIDIIGELKVTSRDLLNGLLDPNLQLPDISFYFDDFDPIVLPGTIRASKINFDIGNNLYNSGIILSDGELRIKAKNILNERRKTNKVANVIVHKGLFKGSNLAQIAYEALDELGGDIQGKFVSLEAKGEIRNRGGSIQSDDSMKLKAKDIINEVQEGEKVVVWDTGNLGRLIGIKNWDKASIYQPGTISSGANLDIEASTLKNLGSDIFAETDINIKAGQLVEQDWVASHHTASDRIDFSGLSINRETRTEHVTRGSTIASVGGSVNIGGIPETSTEIKSEDGTSITQTRNTTPLPIFRNRASNVVAGGHIKIEANDIQITDDTHQSVDRSTSTSLKFDLPATISINHQDTQNTRTTHQSSNFIAGRDINLTAKNDLSVTGSNLISGENLNLTGTNITVQNGLHTDTVKTAGGGTYISFQRGITGGVYGFESEASRETLTPSLLWGNHISINSGNQTNIKASILDAENSLTINSPNLSISGEYERANSEGRNGGFSVTYVPPNMVSVGVNAGYSYSSEGQYQEAVLSAPNLTINSSNQQIDGAVINEQEINPNNHQDYSESLSYSVALSGGTAGISAGIGFDDYSAFAGIGSGGGNLGVGYQNWIMGGTLSPGSSSTGWGQGIFAGNSQFGTIGAGHTTTRGDSAHDVWSVNFNLLAFNGGISFQEGNYIGSNLNLGNISLVTNIQQPFNYTCFPRGTKIRLRRRRKNGTYDEVDVNIEDLQIGDQVLSWNELDNELEWQEVKQVFRRKAYYIYVFILSDGTLIKSTGEHPFYVQGKWVEARDLKIGNKLFTLQRKYVEIVTVGQVHHPMGIEVFNLRVEQNHTYFAEGILVHNYDQEDAKKQNELGALLQAEITDTSSSSEDIVLHGSISSHSLDQTIKDLKELTSVNNNLNFAQRIYFANELQKALIQYQQGRVNDALIKAREVQSLIQLIQSREALESGFISREAHRNLRAAEDTIKSLKEQITDPLQRKSLDEIINRVFWEQAAINGIHWLKSINKAVDDWAITNKLEELAINNLKSIVKKAQQELMRNEIQKLEKQKENFLSKAHPGHGDPKYDPPIVRINEQIYQIQNMFDTPKTFNERLALEKAEIKQKLNEVKNEKDPETRHQKAQELWGVVTEGIIHSGTIERKLGHSQNWKDHGFQSNGPNHTTIPYYNNEYNKYIEPYKQEFDSIRRHHQRREAYLEKIKDELAPFVSGNEMVYFGKMLSPVSSDFDMTGPFGSRFIGETRPKWIWREHKGIDLANGRAGDPVKSTLEGTMTDELGDFGVKHEYESNGKKMATIAVYRHMPSSSYKFKKGSMVEIGSPVGVVGNQGTTHFHLHYEIWSIEYDTLENGDIIINPANENPKIKNRVGIDPTLGYFPGVIK